MSQDRVRQAANVVGAIAQVAAVPALQVTGSGDIGAVSDRYPTYVVPAGYAFSIWSLIFVLSLAYAVWQALPAQRERPLLRRVGWFTAAAFLGCALWQVVFPVGLFALSVALIFAVLASLAVVVGRTVGHREALSRAERWLVRVGFSIFLGWITVASVANTAQTLSAAGWDASDPGAATWGVVMLAAAGVIGAAVAVVTRANLAYAATVVWALVAVYVGQRTGAPPWAPPPRRPRRSARRWWSAPSPPSPPCAGGRRRRRKPVFGRSREDAVPTAWAGAPWGDRWRRPAPARTGAPAGGRNSCPSRGGWGKGGGARWGTRR